MLASLLPKLIDLIAQLLVLGVAGGAVAWLYSRRQRNRDLRLSTIRELAGLHGRFIALRFRANSFHIEWRGRPTHPLNEDEARLARWDLYQEACNLIGEFHGLKPMLIELFPDTVEDVDFLHQRYQDWRRQLGANKPVLQDLDGKSHENYRTLREKYARVMSAMRKRV